MEDTNFYILSINRLRPHHSRECPCPRYNGALCAVNIIRLIIQDYQGCGPVVDYTGSGSGSGSDLWNGSGSGSGSGSASGHDFHDIKGTGITHLHVYIHVGE